MIEVNNYELTKGGGAPSFPAITSITVASAQV
jgi:hypothetical protein